MNNTSAHHYAVVVAGGSGTRLWPLSRRDLPKQMQKFISDKTLIDETVDRLKGTIPIDNIYVSTSENYSERIRELLPDVPTDNFIIEPVARGTTAAFSLIATIIYRRDPDAIIYSLASDHAVTGFEEFQATITAACSFIEAHPGQIALVGIKPDRPDTGLGYIKTNDSIQDEPLVYSVEKFVEKPSLKVAKKYLKSGEYYWNAAYYCFKAETFLDAYTDADPRINKYTDAYLDTGNVEEFMKIPIKAHEIELIDSSKYPLALIPADFKWSDIGNWQTLHQLLAEFADSDVVHKGEADHHIDVNSSNCLVYSDDNRLIATVGLDNVVVVSTKDALLVLNKDQPQDIKQLLEQLQKQGLNQYL